MSISLKRIQAIFIKDYKEFTRNYAISIMVLFPIVFALLYRGNESAEMGTYGFLYNFTFAMLTSFIQACLIAEEKERNTLRSMMMTPASTWDVLIGKSALVFVISSAVLAVVTYLLGSEPANIGAFLIANILSIILYSALGTICGLFSKTLLEASLSVFPVLILFTGAPFGLLLVDDVPLLKVLDYMPSSQFIELLDVMQTTSAIGEVAKPLLIMLAWTIVLTVVSVVMYQKRLKDE
ncbi:ABC transporter permease [Cohnella thailandensis]|uniref:ABC transporter permease n=1 Tax=Cohnella thailandensis TaxID=557557 RepID=A0A841ST27_9BACL|nr:ABC transporter permease [Cohnella thailandensis]MBB6634129.1 ABC transporter permease [Cohnella thailandensis]MBP1972378.1 ABC-2 type transport system permease protein [Cohnella thailandensis]